MSSGASSAERTFECENCGAKYNTHGRHCPLQSCYECGEPNPWRRVKSDGDETAEIVTLELSERQRERFEEVRELCSDDGLPDPTDGQVLETLLDTWDAVDAGHYSGGDDE